MSPTISIDDVTQAAMDLNIEEEQLLSESDKPTTKNYWDAFNPIAPAGTRPENRMAGGIMQSYLGGGMGEESAWRAEAMDPEDSVLKPLLDAASSETRAAIFEQALSTEHAIQIYNLRGVRDDAYMAIENDSLGQQLLGGALPALASPFTAVPVTAVMSTSLRLGKAASVMASIGEVAAYSSAAAIGDELIAGAQGMEEHKLAAGIGGAVAGGGISAFTHILSGLAGKSNANIVLAKSDTYVEDAMNENNFYVFTENGAPRVALAPQGAMGTHAHLRAKGSTQLERTNRNLLDKIPWINKFITADPIKVYMSNSAVGRNVMSKIVAPTQAMLDAAGNAVNVGRTAFDFKMSRMGVFGKYQKGMMGHMADAKEAGMFTNRETFIKDMSKQYHDMANKQSMDLHYYIQAEGTKFDNSYGDALSSLQKKETLSGKPPKQRTPEEEMKAADDLHRTERRKFIDKAKDDFYNNYKADWTNANPHVGKAAQGAQKYFNEHLATNKQLGMKGTMTTNKNKLYAPRILSHNLFDKNGLLTTQTVATFKDDVRRAFKSHPGNDDLTPVELEELVNEYVSIATNVEQRMLFTHGSFLAPNLSGDARMKGRKFDMDMEIMGKYMETDMDSLIGKYQYQMSGRQSMYFGFGSDVLEGDEGVMKKILDDMLAKEGQIDQEVVGQIKNTMLDLSGQLRMNALSDTPAWTFTRSLQMLNSSRLGGGFGGNQLIELTANMFTMPTKSMLKGKLGKSLKESAKLMYGDSRESKEFMEMLINSGFLEDGLAINHANRYADTELGFNSGTYEKGLAGMTDSMHKWNGMRFFKTTMEHLTGGAVMSEVPRMAKLLQAGKLRGGDAARAARWGLGERELRVLSDQIGVMKTSGMEAMTQEGQDLLQLAIQRGVGENVIQGNSLFIPHWMKVPTVPRVLISQFMRFPMIAHNTLLRRGMSDDKARMAAASFASSMMFMGIKYLREQASINMGLIEERDAKFDYFAEGYRGDNAIKKGLMDSVSYIAPLGMLGTLGDYGSSMITGNEMGSDYRKNADLSSVMGVSYGGIDDVLDIMQQPWTGAMTNERTALKVKSLVPWNNFPILDEAIKFGIHKTF